MRLGPASSDSSRADIELLLVLDGIVDLEHFGPVRWGALAIREAPIGSAIRRSPETRVLSIRETIATPGAAALPRQPVVVRSPRLFATTLVSMLRGACTQADADGGTIMRDVVSTSPRAFAETGPASEWLEGARGILHAHFSQRLRMRDVARAVGIHPVHLSRTFAMRYGTTMSEYLRALRLVRASEMLLRTDHPLSRIAMSTGFADHAHFTRAFTECIREAPSSFRRIARARAAA